MTNQTIYIFDGDPAAALVTQRGLQTILGASVTVRIAPTADAAWMACADGNVDLLILDPGAAGNRSSTLLRALHTYRPHIPIVVLTAYDTPGLRQRMRDLGVSAYLAKPAELRELVSLVKARLSAPAAGLAAAS